jgi:xylitol oxidase
MNETNWAGTHAYAAAEVHRPADLDEVRQVLAAAQRIRVLGSRHSFNDIADSDALVSLDGLPADVRVDHDARTVSFGAALRYGELAAALAREGVALHNLASLPHISVAGAVATATHGSGDRNGNLATAVAALELITSEGEVLHARRGDRDFDGMVVGLGALGAVSRITLDVEPAYDVRQRVFEALSWEALFDHFDDVFAAGDSVSVFTRWGRSTDQVWVKSRVTAAAEDVRPELFGALPATVDRHPILGFDAINCSPQLGVPGAWADRLPHFRMGFTPSAGDEMQSEYLLPRAHAVPAINAVRELAPAMRPVLLVSEIRTVAADALWMSPQYERDTVALHFTWTREHAAVLDVVARLEAALAPFGARPHWGKVFAAGAGAIRPLYPRAADFAALAARLDPRGAFRNAWLERHLLDG